MGRLSVNHCAEPAILFWHYQNIQEGHGTIYSGVFTGKLDVWIYGIYVIQEAVLWAVLMMINV